MAAINFGTSTYAGEVLNDLISHAVQGNDTYENGLVHIESGIQFKQVLPTIKLGDIIQDNKPTPVSTDSVGAYTIGERYLQPEEFMVYLEFNPRDYETFWKPFQPEGNLVFRELDPAVQAKMFRLLIEKKNEYLGQALWMSTKGGGTTGFTTPTGGEDLGLVDKKNKYWDGYMKRLLLSAKDDTAPEKVIISGNTVLDTGAKVEAALYAMYKACPKQIRKRKMLTFVTDFDVWDLYDTYLSAKDSKYTENKDVNDYRFKGKRIIPINDIAEQTIILAEFGTDRNSNFWVGVDYANDGDIVKVEPLQANSELYFFQMRMKLDVNIVKPGEIVMHSAYINAV